MIAKSLADAMSKKRQLYQSQLWCTVRVESDLRDSSKIIFYRRFDVSSFWEDQLKKEMTFISEKKTIRRTGMRNIYPVFQPPVHSFNWGQGEFYLFLPGTAVFTQGILRSVKNGRRRKTLPYLYTIYMFCIAILFDLQYVTAVDIMLSQVMIKPDYTV